MGPTEEEKAAKKREAARLRMRRWRAKQPPLTEDQREAKRIYNTAYYAKNGEALRSKQRERNAASYAANPEKQQEANRRWALAHPEAGAERQARRRARKLSANLCEEIDRLDVAERDNWICQLCGEPIDPKTPLCDPVTGGYHPGYLHIDHKIPLSKGGDHSYANSQASHALCNKRKSAKLL